MMKEAIGLFAVVLGFVAYAPYFRDIFANKVHPHPYSWFIWGLTSVLIFILQILHGAGAGSWTTATVALISFAICVLALRQGGNKNITWHDQVMLVASLVAVMLWLLADEPTLSMLLLTSADLFGLMPSIRKTWDKPYSETLTMWSVNGFRHIISIFALSSYTVLTLANPVVWAAGNLGFCAIVLIRRRKIN